LLQNSVSNRFNAQQAFTIVVLGEGDASDVLRLLALFLHFASQARQFFRQIRFKRTQALPVNSGRDFVAFDMFEGFIQTMLR